MTTLIEQLTHRYATKIFDTEKKVDEETLNVLEETLRLTPSSFGIEPRHFVIVSTPEIKAKLLERSPMNPSQIDTCSHIIVLCGLQTIDETYIDKHIAYALSQWGDPERLHKYQAMLKERMQALAESGTMQSYIHNQVYIALGNLLTACAVLGVDACPMGGFVPHVYNEILGLTEQWLESVVLCAIGYRATEDKAAQKPKVRRPLSEIVTYV